MNKLSSSREFQPWLAAFFIFLALAIFDALVGGAISTILRIGGWSALDQRLNDVYHLNYAIIVIAALIWHYSYFKLFRPTLAIAILFLGYVEDTLFYCFAPPFNPAIKILTKGDSFQMAAGALLPQQISGWIGWLGRTFLNRNIALALPAILALNAIVVLIAIVLFCLKGKSAHDQTTG